MRLLVVISILLFPSLVMAFGGPYSDFEEVKLKQDGVKYISLKCDSNSFDTLFKYVDSFKQIAGIAFIGKVDKEEHVGQALSHFRMLEQIIFIDNNLSSLPIGGSSSTIKEIWLKGSPSISSASLNAGIQKANYLKVLKIDSINIKEVPKSIKDLSLLTTLQISKSKLDFDDIVSTVKKLKHLKELTLSNNNFQFVGSNIRKLKGVEFLDLSGNQLSDFPEEIEELERLDSLVINRNNFSSKEDVARKLKAPKLKYVVFDLDTGMTEVNVEYSLPGVKVDWTENEVSKTNFELPNPDKQKVAKISSLEELNMKSGFNQNLGSSKAHLLSPAYIVYDKLIFPNPLKNFDTTSFRGRFLDNSYEFTRKINFQTHTENGFYYPLKYDKDHNKYYKKKKLKKIKHYKQSPVQFFVEKTPEELKGKILISIALDMKRKDLDAYRGVVWELVDYSSKEQFEADFINQKSWSDLRLYMEDEGVHKIVLKGRFTDDSLYVLPRNSTKLLDEKFVEKKVPKMHKKYLKNMVKMEKKFDKSLGRDIRKLQRKDIHRINALWKEVEEKMTPTEKEMPRYKWFEYYNEVKENEWPLLARAKVDMLYLSRFLVSQDFRESEGEDFFVGQKWKSIKVLNKDSIEMEFTDFCLVDLDRKFVKYFEADSINKILAEPFHKYVFVAKEKSSGRIIMLYPKDVEELFKNEVYIVDPKNIKTSVGTNASFYRTNILKELNAL